MVRHKFVRIEIQGLQLPLYIYFIIIILKKKKKKNTIEKCKLWAKKSELQMYI